MNINIQNKIAFDFKNLPCDNVSNHGGVLYMNEFETQLISELKRLNDNLEKMMKDKAIGQGDSLSQIASELESYEPALARLVREYDR